MNERTDLDRLLTAWLTADAPVREPEPLLGAALARTARTRRRPAWRIPERWFPVSVISSRSTTVARVPWRSVGLVALLVIALAAAAAVYVGTRPRARPAPFGPAANGVLAYAVDGDVVMADSPTATPRTIIGGTDRHGLPWFSPDGSRFAFVKGGRSDSGSELWAADATGANPIRLAAAPYIGGVEWSPQQDVIVVLSDNDPTAITMVRADGTGSTTIRPDLADIEEVTWRPPDGRQLVFRGQDASADWGIYVMDRDGANLHRLDLEPGFRSYPRHAESKDLFFQSPRWSPDGSTLLYASMSPNDRGLWLRLAEIDRAGVPGGVRTIGDPARASQFAPMFLPGGDGVVFQEIIDGKVSVMQVGLTPGAVPRDLHIGGVDGFGIAISPDGTKLVTIVAPNDQVWLTDLASGTSFDLGYVVHDVISWQRRGP